MTRILFFLAIRAFFFALVLALLPPVSQAQETVFFPIVVKQSTPLESKLPDTGIYFCANGTAESRCPNFGEAFYGQDAHYNPPLQQHRYTDNEDGTVTDHVTGLMWMQQDDATQRYWDSARTYCQGSYRGYDDWRLPEMVELWSIRNLGRSGTLIDSVFTSCQSDRYWSNTTYQGDTDFAWIVNFDSECKSDYELKASTQQYVRCVRNGPLASAEYQVDVDVVTDTSTGLMWMKGAGGQVDWQAALAYCEDSEHHDYSDWRLPNRNELESLVDYSRDYPSINVQAFSCQSEWYWSSSPDQSNSAKAWGVNFTEGYSFSLPKTASTYYVRCVRSGP